MHTPNGGMPRQLRILVTVTVTLLIAHIASAYDEAFQPAWWTGRNVISTNALNDPAPLNQGQVKWLTRQAYEEFKEKLPGTGNSNMLQRIESFTDQGNYLPVNLGQLKNAVTPCYDRLIEFGLAGSYPWDGNPDLMNDYAFASVEQAKDFFNFELPVTTWAVSRLPPRPCPRPRGEVWFR